MANEYVRQVSYTSIERDEIWASQEITEFNKRSKDADPLFLDLPASPSINKMTVSEPQKKMVDDESIIRSPDMDLSQYDLDDSWEKLNNFESYERENKQNMKEYISTFDAMYQQISKKGMVLSSEILSFKLLKGANVSKKGMFLVLRRINYSKLEDLYEQTKNALTTLEEYKENKKRIPSSSSVLASKDQITGRFYMILDSACSGTVCGKKWLDRYLSSLDEEMKEDVEYNPGTKTFVFGGGEPLKSIASCRIPAVVAGKEVTVLTDVVHSEIPLIYSLSDMKKSNVKLDFTNDTAEIYGKMVHLNMTPTGHYCVPIDSEKTRKDSVSDSRLKNLSKLIQDTRSR